MPPDGPGRSGGSAPCLPGWLRTVLLAGVLAGTFATGWLYVEHVRQEDAIAAQRLAESQQLAARVAADLRQVTFPAERLATTIAGELTAGRLGRRDLQRKLLDALGADDDLFTVGVAYEPGSSEASRFAPDAFRRASGIEYVERRQSEYTSFDARWYGDPFLNGARWNEPYFDQTAREMVATYAVPFYAPGADPVKDDPAGIVHAGYSTTFLRRFLAERITHASGYGFVVSGEGRFVVHPLDERVRAGQTIFELAWETDDTALHEMGVQALGRNEGRVESARGWSGEGAWLFYHRVPDVGWSLVFEIPHEAGARAGIVRHELLRVLMAGVAMLLLFGCWIAGRQTSGERAAWVGVMAVSLVATAGVCGVWAVATRYPDDAQASTSATDPASVEDYLDDYTAELAAQGRGEPVYVPTGVFVQSIEFISSTNVEVTGYVWQHYPRGSSVRRGFVFPEAVEFSAEPAFDRQQAEGDVVGWFFTATLRESFSYDRYPFDRQEVWLRLWPEDLERDVVLTPDLDSYNAVSPIDLPGVEADFVLPGWNVLSSGFEYRRHSYSSDFGLAEFVSQNRPELYFSVQVERDFLGPFVSKLIPLFVVASMLFALLLLGSKHEQRSSLFGFTAMDVVLGCSALFFVLIFDHAALREALGAPRIMYLEYFYFGLYLAILFVTVNAIAFATTAWKVVQMRDNLLPKLCFWPTYTVGLLVVTMLRFY